MPKGHGQGLATQNVLYLIIAHVSILVTPIQANMLFGSAGKKTVGIRPTQGGDHVVQHCWVYRVLTLSLLAAPLATTAQPRGNLPRIGVLEPTSQERPAPCLFAFQQGLHDLGYVEGQTIHLDYRYGEGHADRLPALAAELVQPAPDVLWLHADPAAWAAKRATTTIPIVIGVSVGLVE
jgi:ABC transporter substrate binding protein